MIFRTLAVTVQEFSHWYGAVDITGALKQCVSLRSADTYHCGEDCHSVYEPVLSRIIIPRTVGKTAGMQLAGRNHPRTRSFQQLAHYRENLSLYNR